MTLYRYLKVGRKKRRKEATSEVNLGHPLRRNIPSTDLSVFRTSIQSLSACDSDFATITSPTLLHPQHRQNASSPTRTQEGIFPAFSRLASSQKADKHPQYLDKRVEVQLNGSRKVMGTLRGYDVRITLPTHRGWNMLSRGIVLIAV